MKKPEKKGLQAELDALPASGGTIFLGEGTFDLGGRPVQPRYDTKKGVYRDCRVCLGRGCVHCPAEAKADYERTSPKLIGTFKLDSKTDMKLLRSVCGPKAIMKAKKEGDRRATELVRELGHPDADPSIVRRLGTQFAGEILERNLKDAKKKTRRGKRA